jgi:hypothetical protein
MTSLRLEVRRLRYGLSRLLQRSTLRRLLPKVPPDEGESLCPIYHDDREPEVNGT